MVDKKVKETVKSDLAALMTDFKESKVETRIENIKQIDGKIMAQFYVNGLPPKKGEYSDSCHNWAKIFDVWADFSAYAQKFFESEDFMFNEAKNSHNM